MNILLYFVAVILDWLLAIPAFFHAVFGAFRFKTGWKHFSLACLNAALAKDIAANVAYSSLMNDLCIRKGGYHFGRYGETLSSAIGKNWSNGTLTWIGKSLCGFLNFIDFRNWKNGGHCWMAIENPSYYRKPLRIPFYYTLLFPLLFTLIFSALIALYSWLL